MTQISISLPDDVLRLLDLYAKRKKWSRSQAAALILAEKLVSKRGKR